MHWPTATLSTTYLDIFKSNASNLVKCECLWLVRETKVPKENQPRQQGETCKSTEKPNWIWIEHWKLENCSMVKWYWTIFTRLTDISIYMANVNQKVYIEILRFRNRQNLKNCTLETYVICQKVHNVGIWNSGGEMDFKYWNLCVFQNRISSVSQTEINLILKINIKHTNLF